MKAQTSPAHRGRMQPFANIHRVGLTLTTARKFERYRLKQKQRGAWVELVQWPDGVWCVLAMLPAAPIFPACTTRHPPPLPAVVFDDAQKTEAYNAAKQAVRDGKLPLLILRRDPNGHL